MGGLKMENLQKNVDTIRVIKATTKDASLVSQIISEAFSNDPVMQWWNPHSRELAQYIFGMTARFLFVKHKETYLTSDGAGAALCLPPNVNSDSLSLLPKVLIGGYAMFKTGAEGIKKLLAMGKYFNDHHPVEPHFYIHALGVRHNQNGRGIGTTLLRAIIERCDREGLLAYLENSNIRNLPLYQCVGFRVDTEGQLPFDGPRIWFMVRDAIKK
jgi:ribosomal protein S18 acetylase RimI-like enzyme